jgi:hypothetical protein
LESTKTTGTIWAVGADKAIQHNSVQLRELAGAGNRSDATGLRSNGFALPEPGRSIDALGDVARLADINLVIDKGALEDEGVSDSSPVTFHLPGVRGRSALKQLLEPLNLTYCILPMKGSSQDVLKITNAARANVQGLEIDSKLLRSAAGLATSVLQLSPIISSDERFVRLMFAAGAATPLEGVSRGRPILVKHRQAVLVDITADLQSTGAFGLPARDAAAIRTRFDVGPTERVLLLIVPRIHNSPTRVEEVMQK